MFVIDSADRKRLQEGGKELEKLLSVRVGGDDWLGERAAEDPSAGVREQAGPGASTAC